MSNKIQSASTDELAPHPTPPPFPFPLDPGATVPSGPSEKLPGGAAVTCDCTLLSKHHWIF